MVYSTTQQARDSSHLGTAAKRALDGLLGDIYKADTQKWLSQQLRDLQKCQGLHLASGNGHESFMLATLLDDESTLMGIEEDAVLVQAARNAGFLETREAVQFHLADPFIWASAQAFDFVYTRMVVGRWTDQRDLLQTIRKHLKDDGVLLIEVATFSEFRVYPYNHAFARAMELIGLLETQGAAMQPEQVQVSLRQAGFELSDLSMALPAFISGKDNRRVVSLALEACRDGILHCRSSTAEEINALLLELKEFEQQDDTLISRPGLLQLAARPTGPTSAQAIEIPIC